MKEVLYSLDVLAFIGFAELAGSIAAASITVGRSGSPSSVVCFANIMLSSEPPVTDNMRFALPEDDQLYQW